MKVKVTMPKAHDADNKPIPVGTILDIDGDVMPAFLVNKAEIVDKGVEKAEQAAIEAQEKADELATKAAEAKEEAGQKALSDGEKKAVEDDKSPSNAARPAEPAKK